MNRLESPGMNKALVFVVVLVLAAAAAVSACDQLAATGKPSRKSDADLLNRLNARQGTPSVTSGVTIQALVPNVLAA